MRKIPKAYYFELAVFLMHFHSGQFSRGYRLLCKLGLSNLTSTAESEAQDSEMYQYLAVNYAKSV